MKGEYLKNCNCIAFCPCDGSGDPSPHAFCEGVVAMRISEGSFEGTDLSGLKWAVTFHFPGALYEGNGSVEAFIDEEGNEAQRDAIGQILSGEVGGTWFEVVAALAPNFLGAHFVPIEWEFDKARRHARVRVDEFFEMTNAPILIKPTGDENHM
ncbi:MAG: DUF1326 domain-containing protein, partial [Propionibacteriaceae bacterium]|nr:DUF1326 domain-containing protein [Propionibacteriaceae bacterium]